MELDLGAHLWKFRCINLLFLSEELSQGICRAERDDFVPIIEFRYRLVLRIYPVGGGVELRALGLDRLG